MQEKKIINSWDDFIFYTGSPIGIECIQSPRNDKEYNSPSIGFYKDGSVWVSGAKGSVRLYKTAPYKLMYEMWKQCYDETFKENKKL